jgi:hypothetical protein
VTAIDQPLRGTRAAEPTDPVVVRARVGQVGYGFSIGILMLDGNTPSLPGDVGNASSFGFPVQYRLVPGASAEAVVDRQDPSLAPLVVEEARYLVGQGVRAITSNCGYMGAYQAAVAAAVEVPVFLSSLLQVPMLVSMLGPQRKLAVLVADATTVSERLLGTVGITAEVQRYLLFRGLEDKPYFRAAFLGEKDVEHIEKELVETALTVLRADTSVGAFLFECSDMPRYSHAVQQATGLPVFDWIGFINYVHHAVVRRPYAGIM